MASGRQKALRHNKLRPPCHPLTSFGVPGIFNTKPSVTPRCGSTLGYDYAALRAQNSAHYVRLYGLANFQFAWKDNSFSNDANAKFIALLSRMVQQI